MTDEQTNPPGTPPEKPSRLKRAMDTCKHQVRRHPWLATIFAAAAGAVASGAYFQLDEDFIGAVTNAQENAIVSVAEESGCPMIALNTTILARRTGSGEGTVSPEEFAKGALDRDWDTEFRLTLDRAQLVMGMQYLLCREQELAKANPEAVPLEKRQEMYNALLKLLETYPAENAAPDPEEAAPAPTRQDFFPAPR